MDAIKDCDALVHLAGEGIFNRRWSTAFKDLIYASRGSRAPAISSPPWADRRRRSSGVLVNGSAIGYYGPHGDEELIEESLAGNDFLARVCVDWEKAAQAALGHGCRVVLLRTGVVLDPLGGAPGERC